MSQLSFRTLGFQELTKIELYQILQLRSEVFVVEQDCVYLDIDDNDYNAYHVLGYSGTQLAAYSRIIPPEGEFTHIGRVIVASAFRQQKFGRILMQYSMDKARSFFDTPIELAAQSYLKEFYQSLGFQISGDEYLLDGIPHVDMQWKETA